MKQTDALDARFKPALDQLLEKIKQGDEPSSVEESSDVEEAVEEPKPVFRSRLLNRLVANYLGNWFTSLGTLSKS